MTVYSWDRSSPALAEWRGPGDRESARTVTARKAHTCNGWRCCHTIQPGEDYARYVIYPGHLAHDGPGILSLAYCQRCATEHGRAMPPRRGKAVAP